MRRIIGFGRSRKPLGWSVPEEWLPICFDISTRADRKHCGVDLSVFRDQSEHFGNSAGHRADVSATARSVESGVAISGPRALKSQVDVPGEE
jgi:hypothetical protein